MNASAFRHLYNYHFAENRATWEKYIVPLSEDLFIQDIPYSRGSVKNHIIHMISVDATWFSPLRGLDIPEPLNPDDFPNLNAIRTQWDAVERDMRGYLDNLRDETLSTKPFPEGEDENLIVWQVLLHVVNHGTDHRAQVLRILHDMGVKTVSQDYIFYVYDNPMP